MATPGPVTIAKGLIPNLPYDPERDFATVSLVNAAANVFAIHPSIPARTMKEFVALAAHRPTHIGVSAIGSVQHLLAEMMKRETRARVDVVAYKGGAQVAIDVAGGQIESMWNVLPVVLPLIESKRIRALAVASEKRSALLPLVPTTAEAGWPNITGTAWNGLVAPAATPQDIISRLNNEISGIVAAADMRERFTSLGMEPMIGTPQQFAEFLKAETARWAEVVKAANIKIE
jgi:tripartite-type tricarboxylate transporter receptor subunit TctC